MVKFKGMFNLDNLFKRNMKEAAPKDDGARTDGQVPDDLTNPGSESPESNQRYNEIVLQEDEPFIKFTPEKQVILFGKLMTTHHITLSRMALIYVALKQKNVTEALRYTTEVSPRINTEETEELYNYIVNTPEALEKLDELINQKT